MASPRRIADGPALDPLDAPQDSAPRRGVVKRGVRARLLPSAVALATAATAGALVLTSSSGLPFAAGGASSASATTAPAGQATLFGASSATSAAQVVSQSEEYASAVAESARITAQRAAAEQAAADKAAAEKAAAEKAAAEKKAAAAKAATQKVTTTTTAATASNKKFAPASNYGLRGGAVKTYNAVMSNFSGINSVGGYRASSLSNHQLGLAIDFMITPGSESALGWSIAKYLVAHASELNVDHVIFEQKIWTPANPTWRLMEDRGSVTDNHYDHVHVSMKS